MHIGFYGATGSYDFGDYAMMIENIKYFYAKDKSIQITIFTPSINITYECLRENIVDKQLLSHIHLESDDFYKPEFQIITIIKKTVYKLVGKNDFVSHKAECVYNETYKENFKNINNQSINTINDLDVIVFNGGGYIQNGWTYHNYNFMILINIAASLKKQVLFLGNSFGPLDKKYEIAVRQSLKYVDGIIVRDGFNFSYRTLIDWGIDRNKLLVNSDDLMFINCKNNSDIVKGKFIIIELMMWISRCKKGRQYVLKCFKEFTKFIIDQGNDVVFVSLDRNDNTMEYIRKEIYIPLNCDKRIHLFECNENVEYIFQLYRKASFSISMKYHPLVLSLASETPCMGIICDDDGYYFSKMNGVFESINNVQKNIVFINDITVQLLIDSYVARKIDCDSKYRIQNLLQQREKFIDEKLRRNYR